MCLKLTNRLKNYLKAVRDSNKRLVQLLSLISLGSQIKKTKPNQTKPLAQNPNKKPLNKPQQKHTPMALKLQDDIKEDRNLPILYPVCFQLEVQEVAKSKHFFCGYESRKVNE